MSNEWLDAINKKQQTTDYSTLSGDAALSIFWLNDMLKFLKYSYSGKAPAEFKDGTVTETLSKNKAKIKLRDGSEVTAHNAMSARKGAWVLVLYNKFQNSYEIVGVKYLTKQNTEIKTFYA